MLTKVGGSRTTVIVKVPSAISPGFHQVLYLRVSTLLRKHCGIVDTYPYQSGHCVCCCHAAQVEVRGHLSVSDSSDDETENWEVDEAPQKKGGGSTAGQRQKVRRRA